MNEEHLSEEQWTAALLNEDREARTHIAECAECAAEEQRLRAALAGYGEEAREAAQRPAAFWAWQRDAIAGRLAAQRTPARRLVWAGTLALVILLAAAVVRQAPPQPAAVDPDEALLVDVQRSLRREVPATLAPATLLANEMNRAAEAYENRNSPQRR